jgi:hypothetical protein
MTYGTLQPWVPRDAGGARPDGKLCLGCEATSGLAEQHGDVAGSAIGRGDVEAAIAVEGVGGDGVGATPAGNAVAAPKSPSPRPNKTETLLSTILAVARSRWP